MRPRVERLDDRCLLSGLTAAQMRTAYGLDAVRFLSPSGTSVAGDGSGETIALVEAYHDPTLRFDLRAFDQANHLPAPKLTVVNLAGKKSNDPWAAEESLDVEWAHAIAPGAGILVVEARSQSLTDLMAAVDVARHRPGVVAVSMSWGFDETQAETAYDSRFTTPPGHVGISFVAASGDNGQAYGAGYPASSPRVLSVGGTTLNLDAQGHYVSETAWRQSGGGYSLFEPEPAFQASVQSTGSRSTPDVAFDADPMTGAEVFQTPLRGGRGSWQAVGGTSLGAPAWAAIVAIADQGRSLAGKSSLDGPTQTLPALYALPASDFHPVSPPPALPWGGLSLFGYLFPFQDDFSRPRVRRSAATSARARPQANTMTGLGSPNAPSLIADLVAIAPSLVRPAAAETVSAAHRSSSGRATRPGFK
jgi:hypothetical protein